MRHGFAVLKTKGCTSWNKIHVSYYFGGRWKKKPTKRLFGWIISVLILGLFKILIRHRGRSRSYRGYMYQPLTLTLISFSKPHESMFIRHQHRRIPEHRSFPLEVLFNSSMLLSTKTYPVNQLVMKHQQTSELPQKQAQSLPADGVGLHTAVKDCFGLCVQSVLSSKY